MGETEEGSGAWTDPVGRVAPLDWATDVIAAGAGTAPRLNTARRDKGGVTHICRGAIAGIASYEGSDKCRPSHKTKQSDNTNNNSNSSNKKRDKTGDTQSYCLIMDKH